MKSIVVDVIAESTTFVTVSLIGSVVDFAGMMLKAALFSKAL